ncbi:MAG: hypothetical protein N3E38_00900 [Candidatus Aenigmarchaeota archaeon]|nr:hypothetical protein [Candidatus Aenigmarchaeota archaeon]MCX8179283.1 hypothetical protein [Candidatus Aenigmarchaeota archaeon]
MTEELWPTIITTKMGGVIFRKALMENNWSKVYENFVYSLIENEIENETSLLKVFGNIGG